MEVRSIEAIVAALGSAKVEYLIVGGLAVNAHGYERLTRDVDLVIGLRPDNIIRGLRALLGIGYQMSVPVTPEEFADPLKREAWRKDKNMIVLKLWSDVHRRTPIDVFVYEPFDFAREFAGAKRVKIAGDLEAPIVGYEGLIAMKSAAGREKDLLDIKALRKLEPYR
jgi:predicted nucleotidyltransferase